MNIVSFPRQDPSPAHYRAFVRELIEVGSGLVDGIHDRVTQRAASFSAAALAFEHASRAVCRAILLAERLDGAVAGTRPRHPADARRAIVRAVERAIERQRAAPRNRVPPIAGRRGKRPPAEVIASICRDLGLATMPGLPPGKHPVPDDIASLCRAAAAKDAA